MRERLIDPELPEGEAERAPCRRQVTKYLGIYAAPVDEGGTPSSFITRAVSSVRRAS